MAAQIYRTLVGIDEHNAFLSAEPHPMPGIQKTRENQWKSNLADGAALKPSDVLSVPGGKIMKRTQGVEVEQLFEAFCDHFHTTGNWTWTGGRVTPAAAAILDGDDGAKVGQCQALAAALRFLATARKPYGLDIGSTRLGSFGKGDGLYTGRYQAGFFSEHPVGGILGLLPNVYEPLDRLPTPTSRLAPLYGWENHKVLKYGGRYYDPSYRKQYTQLSDMAAYHLRATTNFADTTKIVEAEMCSGSPVFFLELSSTDIKPLGRGSPIYMGPYARREDVPSKLLG